MWSILWVYIRKHYYIYKYLTEMRWAQIWGFCCSQSDVGSQHPDRLSGGFRSKVKMKKNPLMEKSPVRKLCQGMLIVWGLMKLLSTSYKYEQHLWARDRKTSNETESALGQRNVNTLKSMKKKSCLKVKRPVSLWDMETSFLSAPQASFQAEPAGLTKTPFITV